MQVQAIDLKLTVSMPNPVNRLFCRLDGLTPAIREQQRVSILKNLGLLEADTIPLFEEAVQTAARYLEAPICILGLMVNEQVWLKSAIGLSHLGLMNELASSRKITRQEAFCTYVVDSHQPLIIYDTYNDLVFARSTLAQYYGIRSYLGSPLITAEGWCIGTLSVMDLVPREFSQKDLEFLTLSARWCLREYERDHLLKTRPTHTNEWVVVDPTSPVKSVASFSQNLTDNAGSAKISVGNSINTIKLKLLKQLTQELRAPLTSVIGMASVILGGVFGSLTSKQKEYLDIIYNSGQQLNSLVDEILRLGGTDDLSSQLTLNPLNIEMLCQQILNDLGKVAAAKRQELRLSVEPGQRIWLLDKDKAQQAIYYLMLSVLNSSEAGGEVRVHISRKTKTLNLAFWVSHPWLADGLPQINLLTEPLKNSLVMETEGFGHKNQLGYYDPELGNHILSASCLESALCQLKDQNLLDQHQNPQQILGLLLACHFAESHGGKILIQGSSESGYRYVLTLPKVSAQEE
ncbi:GAF sensor signal transduction histidine kinase [Gloeothece citriformis PCC 7424]|uniref:histidine kinase n=1 Tax=Gloeothece citriformis (strain PCC 7424) TaxID=65393 RepID=B7KFI7_GLOC7|nr:GAF domain-containing protein [Gloeothece citriformis]ACK73312.1 GAF sensor signal transduction histidine kinase [Gloeothece citriformis PCC 7424]